MGQTQSWVVLGSSPVLEQLRGMWGDTHKHQAEWLGVCRIAPGAMGQGYAEVSSPFLTFSS